MIGYILKKSLGVLARKPIMLWGVSLLYGVIAAVITILGINVPIIAVPITLTLSAGMSALYLSGYTGGEVNANRLFDGFTEGRARRVIGGMCWYKLWSIIWGWVPIVGIVKSYSYRFTPYILLTREDISPTDALKVSMTETRGIKLTMFLTDLLVNVLVVLAGIVLGLLSIIPFLGRLFALALVLYIIAVIIFLPLLKGVIGAAFYQETKNGSLQTINQFTTNFNANASTGAPAADWFCSACGTANVAGTNYCRACGKKHETPTQQQTPSAPADSSPADSSPSDDGAQQ